MRDDGVGLAAGAGLGVGLRSMRERAEELGGSCTVAGDRGRHGRRGAACPLQRVALVSAEPLRVLVVDDHPSSATDWRRCRRWPRLRGRRGGRRRPRRGRLALDLQPDVVLMDLHMPRVNGIDATRRMCRPAALGVLVLTMLEDDDSVFAAMRAGARGYLLKGAAAAGDRAGDRRASAPARPSSGRHRVRVRRFFAPVRARSRPPFPS